MESLKYFMAVCKNNLEDKDGFFYTAFFVNNSNLGIKLIEYDTWGYMSDDDEDSFDFVIHFISKITYASGGVNKKIFRIDKCLSNGVKKDNISFLNKSGYLFGVI